MRVAEIRIYPVKGLRGRPVADAVVEPWGLAGDRRYMVVDETGKFLSQRELPRMAVLEAALRPGGLNLSGPGLGLLAVDEPGPEVPSRDVTVWRDRVPARDAGNAAAVWLSAALGRACRLVHMADPAAARQVDPDFSESQDRVSFADGFPVLVTNAASLADLNARLPVPIPMDRFRTNIAVVEAEAWAEDGWQRLHIGPVPFAGTKDCARCAVTTVDQDTGERSPENEPVRTLAQFRRKAGGRIIFGQNLIPRGTGRIAVGDTVRPG